MQARTSLEWWSLAAVRAFIDGPWPNYAVEFRLRHKDGSYRWILAASLVHDAEGKPIRMLGAHIDITDKKRVEQALAEREAQLTLCIEHCPTAVAMLDRDLRYLAVSRRWCTDFRVEPSVVGRSCRDVFPALPDRWEEVYRRGLRGTVEDCEDDQFAHADGSFDPRPSWSSRMSLQCG